MAKKKVFYLISHPIQYQAPLFKKLAQSDKIDFTAVFLTDQFHNTYFDKEFGKKIQWDTPLLNGYKHVFLKNHSPKPSVNSQFYGLINLGIITFLRKKKPDVIIVHGWAYASYLILFLFKFLIKSQLWLKAESPLNQEPKKKSTFKKWILSKFDRFLFIGTQNKRFYLSYNIPENRLIESKYCINNDFFRDQYLTIDQQNIFKKKLKIDLNLPTLIFCGKLIHKKRPLELLKAKNILQKKGLYFNLIILGDGILMQEMKDYIKAYKLQNNHLIGFVNQTELPAYYSISDAFILPSGKGETWGLVVNEAMNYKLPVIVSSMVGSAEDLAIDGISGYQFKCGDIEDLAHKIELLIGDDKKMKKMGQKAYELISEYSYDHVVKNIEDALSKK